MSEYNVTPFETRAFILGELPRYVGLEDFSFDFSDFASENEYALVLAKGIHDGFVLATDSGRDLVNRVFDSLMEEVGFGIDSGYADMDQIADYASQ